MEHVQIVRGEDLSPGWYKIIYLISLELAI